MSAPNITFKLATPSFEGCKSCGSSAMDCQCIKFGEQATRNGSTMDDLAKQAPLMTAFSLYGQPKSPAIHSARDFSSQSTSSAIAATANNSADAAIAATGPSSGMF